VFRNDPRGGFEDSSYALAVPGVLASAGLAVISDVVVVVAVVIAIIVGALFVSGRIAPRADSAEPEDNYDANDS
jgi:hypothetical protein